MASKTLVQKVGSTSEKKWWKYRILLADEENDSEKSLVLEIESKKLICTLNNAFHE